MPLLSAAAIILTPEQEQDLHRLSRAHKAPRKLAERAAMILLSAGKAAPRDRPPARHLAEDGASLARPLAGQPADSPGRDTAGRCAAAKDPATFTPEQTGAIMALACGLPEQSNLPLSRWSQSELAREAVRRGIVDSISHGSVGRFLTKKPTSSRPSRAAG